jgi:hypothetical protein
VDGKRFFLVFLLFIYFFALFCFAFSTGVRIQGLILARQVIIHLAVPPVLVAIGYFSDRVSFFCSGMASDYDPSTYTFQLAEITVAYHHANLFIEMGVLLTFCLG